MIGSSSCCNFRSGFVTLALLLLQLGSNLVYGYDSVLLGAGSITLTDVASEIPDLQSLFLYYETYVSLTDIEWEYTGSNATSNNILKYETYVNGVVAASGEYDLSTYESPPTNLDCGIIVPEQSGATEILVKLMIDSAEEETSSTFQAYKSGVSLIPLIVILVLAFSTQMVELSLFLGIFVGACIVAGSVIQGFKLMLDDFILGALADAGHVYVILFTLFLSGCVGMMQKSGGLIGFTSDIAKLASTPMRGMFCAFWVGVFIFFDDYTNVLLAGETMRPLLDQLAVSREKLSFVVDGTSAPIASIAPISSWVGFEVGLIQDQLTILIAREEAAGRELTITDSAFGIFLQSIKYRYYPIFMIVLMLMVILSQRDFGPMLVIERICRVYDLHDGGPNRGKASQMEGKDENQPRPDQPLKSWNMFFPVLLLIALVFYLLVATGTIPGEEQTFLDKIEASDSFSALLWATMATAIITLIFYHIQFTREGTNVLAMPSPKLFMDMLPGWLTRRNRTEDDEPRPRPIMTVRESVESFLFGTSRVFMALIVLTLAWASGSVMIAVGADRLFSAAIRAGIPVEMLPTIVFICAFLMALATGTSWGTMSILFPLVLIPTYDASNGNPTIFYAVTAGVLSGAVAGDHVSPISDTTVMSALACDVQLLAHVRTQAPYCIVIIIFSILCGTIPIGYGKLPNIVGILLGWGATGAFVFFICKPVMSPTGDWDIFNWIMMKMSPDPRLNELAEDVVRVVTMGEDVSGDYLSKHWEPEHDATTAFLEHSKMPLEHSEMVDDVPYAKAEKSTLGRVPEEKLKSSFADDLASDELDC